jgi:hypothetical protein
MEHHVDSHDLLERIKSNKDIEQVMSNTPRAWLYALYARKCLVAMKKFLFKHLFTSISIIQRKRDLLAQRSTGILSHNTQIRI